MADLLAEAIHADIGDVVRRAEAIRAAELARVANSLEGLGDRERRAVEAMTRAIVKKVLHPPLSHARSLAAAGERRAVQDLLQALGGLPPEEESDA